MKDDVMEGENEIIVKMDSDINIEEWLIHHHHGRLSKWFSPLKSGSLRGSIFNLSATAVGAGLLSLPYCMKIGGLILGTLLMITGALSALWSMHLFIQVAQNVNSRELIEVCRKSAGNFIAILYSAAVIFDIAGMIILYQIVGYETINLLLIEFGASKETVLGEYKTLINILENIFVAIFILFPMCIMKDMSSFRYASLLSLITIGYTILLVIIEFPFFWMENYKPGAIQWGFDISMNTFDAFSFAFFAFICQITFFNVYDELQNNIQRRIHKVVRISISLNFILYYLTATFGYLSSFDKTPEVICNRNYVYSGTDYCMTVGKIGVYVTLMISIPINYVGLRRMIYNSIWSSDTPISNPSNLYITAGVLAGTTLISIVFPKIRAVISLIGGIAAVILCYIGPVACYVKKSGMPITHWKVWGSITIASIFSFFGAGSVVNTVINIVTGETK